MNPLQWLKSVTGLSAAASLASSMAHIGETPGWPILIENFDEWDIRAILDGAGIDSWGYFIQPGAMPGTITGATWVTVPRGQAHDAERALRRNGAMVGGRALLDDGEAKP